MSAGAVGRPRAGVSRLPFAATLSGIVAVGTKEVRGRMRGRRAFVVLTVYLALLASFAWMVEVMSERTVGSYLGTAAFASAQIGREIFKGLLLLETVLVVFLAPSFTAGTISLEREKQTLDLLIATPISSPAIVLGKLVSALAYLFLLVVSSIPLTAIVFVFGGVAPDDLVRGYVVLVTTAVGLGAVGLFFSALARRTQAATVLTYFTVLALTAGSAFLFAFWSTMAGSTPTGGGIRLDRGELPLPDVGKQPPAALMWLNPLAAQADVACGAQLGFSTGDIFDPCFLVAQITTGGTMMPVPPVDVKPFSGPGGGAVIPDVIVAVPPAPGQAIDVLPRPEPVEVRYRDRIWPASSAAWLGLSAVLVAASVWLVGPARRPRRLAALGRVIGVLQRLGGSTRRRGGSAR